jgi:hypothetical protein
MQIRVIARKITIIIMLIRVYNIGNYSIIIIIIFYLELGAYMQLRETV